MKDFLIHNKTEITLVSYILFSIFVTALPRVRKDFDLYTYCWDVLHGIAGVLNNKFNPQVKPANPTDPNPSK